MLRIVKPSGVCVAAVMLLGACGGQPFSSAAPRGRTPAGASRLLAAVAHVSDAKTARMSMNLRVEGVGSGSATTVTASGVIDFRAQRAAMTMRVLSAGRTIAAEVRVLDGVVWTNSGSGWSSATSGVGGGSGSLTSDPTTFLAYLRGVASDVHLVGHETVRGVDTTEYSATVDLRRAMERSDANAEVRAQVRAALDLLGNLDVPVKVWIDAQNRVRRFELDIDMSGVMKRAGMPSGMHPWMSILIEFHDYGVPVRVESPLSAGGK